MGILKLNHLLVHPGFSERQERFIRSIGIEIDEIVELNKGCRFLCEELVAPSIPGVEGAGSPWAFDLLRDLQRGLPKLGDAGERIYLVRGDRRRRIMNETAVTKLMVEMGFEVIDAASLEISEQARMFEKAKLIIGAHGAALSNVVFSREAHILELFAPNAIAQDCFNHLAEKTGNSYYWALTGSAPANQSGDFEIELGHLKSVIVDFLSLSETRMA